MSGPSVLHEDRVAILGDLADLAGYVVDARLAANPRPDLVRLHRSSAALLVADAKATETAGNVETRIRLLGYLAAAGPWLTVGFAVHFAICHGPDPRRSWADSVASLARLVRINAGAADVRAIDRDTWISWVSFGVGE
jgi:hypothetical protein